MPIYTNELVKKFLEKMAKSAMTKKNYKDYIQNIEIVFVIDSSSKTKNCDWIYGIKIIHDNKDYLNKDSLIIKNLISEIRKQTDSFFKEKICCTDYYFE
jgi:predicted metallopeptidase